MKSVDAVGIMFHSAATHRYLYLLRNDPKHPGSWGLPGGKIESGESMLDAVTRECQEELGMIPAYQKLIPIEKFTSNDNNFNYHTFFCAVAQEFVPKLNHEHIGYAWIAAGTVPKPLHPGLYATFKIEEIRDKLAVIERH